MLVDSDDELSENALEILYTKAQKTNADIVHAKASVFLTNAPTNEQENRLKKIETKTQNVFAGELFGEEIRKKWILENKHSSFLWAKLIRHSVYKKAFDFIPFMKCTMAEDVVQYFFITTFSQKYVGIQDCVYRYRADSGITSERKIETLDEWEKVCEAAEVYKAIFATILEKNASVSENEKESLNTMCRTHLASSLLQLQTCVSQEIYEQAKEILFEHWGESFVRKIEAILHKSSL